MDPRSEVLLRQPDYFQGEVLLVGLPPDDVLGRLPNAHGWCWHAGDQAALEARFAGRSHFGVEAPQQSFEAAVVFLPKSKDLADYILNAVASRLAGREPAGHAEVIPGAPPPALRHTVHDTQERP